MTNYRRHRGFSQIEMLVVMGIISVMLTMVGLDAASAVNRARTSATLSGVNQVFLMARLQAVRRGRQVVVEVSLEPPSRSINLRTFEDRNGDFVLGTYLSPPQTTPQPEEILGDFTVDNGFRLWKHGAAPDDMNSSVLFNSYDRDPGLRYRVVFQPDGGLVPPQEAGSGPPNASGGRGLYLGDLRGRNFYRLTFTGSLVAMPVLEKWVSPNGYAPNGWTWQ